MKVTPRDSLAHPEARTEILDRVARLQPASQRQWGRMSPHQAVCHMSDGFRKPLGDRVVPQYESFFKRTVMKFVALHTSFPWPKGTIKTTPEADQEAGGTKPVEFARDVDETKDTHQSFR